MMKSSSTNCRFIIASANHRRAILDKSAAINDEGSNAMMSDFISEQEKTIWMMQAWLEE
jgi:starvation-inducible DNA-binding protein